MDPPDVRAVGREKARRRYVERAPLALADRGGRPRQRAAGRRAGARAARSTSAVLGCVSDSGHTQAKLLCFVFEPGRTEPSRRRQGHSRAGPGGAPARRGARSSKRSASSSPARRVAAALPPEPLWSGRVAGTRWSWSCRIRSRPRLGTRIARPLSRGCGRFMPGPRLTRPGGPRRSWPSATKCSPSPGRRPIRTAGGGCARAPAGALGAAARRAAASLRRSRGLLARERRSGRRRPARLRLGVGVHERGSRCSTSGRMSSRRSAGAASPVDGLAGRLEAACRRVEAELGVRGLDPRFARVLLMPVAAELGYRVRRVRGTPPDHEDRARRCCCLGG